MSCIWSEVLQSGKLEYIPWMEAEKLELQQAVKNAIGMDIYKNSPMVFVLKNRLKAVKLSVTSEIWGKAQAQTCTTASMIP